MRTATTIALVTCLTLVVAAPPASAEPANAFTGRWYGWQVLLAGAGLPLTWLGTRLADVDATELDRPLGDAMVVGSTLTPFTPSLVHWAHGYPARAWTSLGVDVGLPLVAGLIFGAAIGQDGADNAFFRCDFTCGFTVGWVLTAPLAILADAFLMSWEDATWEPDDDDARDSFTPMLSAGPDSVALGLSGTF